MPPENQQNNEVAQNIARVLNAYPMNMRQRNTNTLLGFIIALIVGGGMLVGDYYSIKSNLDFLHNSKKAEGTVTEIMRSMSDKGTMFSPKVSFTDESGTPVTFVSGNLSSSPGFHVGEKVSVLYDPAVPEYAKLNTFWQIWLWVVILSGFGLIFFLIGVFGIISKIRNKGLENNAIPPQISA